MSAFKDVRVLDCSRGLAGGMAAMLLADFGAEVVRIEPDEPRRPSSIAWNRNKHRLTLDPAAAEDREQLDRLLGGADLAVFDQGPSELTRLGLDAASLAVRHPRLIHLWTPPYGSCGRWSDLPAHHGALTGLTGAAFRQGSHADQPVWYVAPLTHYAQATLAAAAAGAALLRRTVGGAARSVTVSGLHATAETHCPVRVVGAPAPPRGKPTGGAPNYQLYQCGDGAWLFLGCLLPHFFHKALKVLELTAALGADMSGPIQERIGQAPREHWLALFRANDVPAAPVDRRETWLKSDIITANELGTVLQHPVLGPVEMPGVTAKLESTPGSVRHFAIEASPERLAAFAKPSPAPNPTVGVERSGPLAGIKVLDLGTLIAGAHAATILANFGADVVKIEPAEGDPFRPSALTLFLNYNRGKRGLGLDLKQAAGRELFLELVKSADVVVDNFRLGVRERLGIGHEAVRAVNPRIISCSANTFGSKGADARLPGFDPLLQARSGIMAAQGGAGGAPLYHTIPVTDVATAALTSFAIIAALYARETTGEGQVIETSLAGASALYQFAELTAYEGRPPLVDGSRDCIGFAALDRFYACRDGWLTLACTTPDQFDAVARVLDRDDWRRRWDGAAALAEPRDGALASEIAARLDGLPRDETVDLLVSAGVPATPVLRDAETHEAEFLWENDYFERLVHPVAGDLIASRGFAAFDDEAAGFERMHPQLGEHSLGVLMDFGVPLERIVALAEAGVVFRG